MPILKKTNHFYNIIQRFILFLENKDIPLNCVTPLRIIALKYSKVFIFIILKCYNYFDGFIRFSQNFRCLKITFL